MSTAEKTYSDTTDLAMINMTPTDLFDQWNRFEEDIFNSLLADKTIGHGVLLNAGAGRRITESEAPFFNSFAKLYLLEPDSERRAMLTENTKGSGALLLSDRIEALDASTVDAIDFVQCKYVLQHIHTEVLPLTVERLKAVTAQNGVVGIFSAVSPGNSYFAMTVQDDAIHLLPADLKASPDGRITEAQFNHLMASPPSIPFIATHYISRKTLESYFIGWDIDFTAGPADMCFLLARKSTANPMKKIFRTLKAMIRT